MKSFADICDEVFGYKVSNDIEFYTYERCAEIYKNQLDIPKININLSREDKDRIDENIRQEIKNHYH